MKVNAQHPIVEIEMQIKVIPMIKQNSRGYVVVLFNVNSSYVNLPFSPKCRNTMANIIVTTIMVNSKDLEKNSANGSMVCLLPAELLWESL